MQYAPTGNGAAMRSIEWANEIRVASQILVMSESFSITKIGDVRITKIGDIRYF